MSGGGLTTVETAIRFPVRLVESGPAGGAIFAAGIAAESDLPRGAVVRHGRHHRQDLPDRRLPAADLPRSFEVARIYRFKKGSGLPLRIPVIEMVEIGAGGGSIARVDRLRRITVGPDSAGAEPGPACYGRGGTAPRRDRCRSRAGPHRPDASPAAAWRSTSPPRGARGGRAMSARRSAWTGHRRARRQRDGRREHGQRRARACDRARQDARATAR